MHAGGALSALAAAALFVAQPASAANCEASGPGTPIFITDTCDDPVLNQPYIDIDRQESVIDARTGVNVSYRYVHGGFTDTNVRFAYYFPAADIYKGRFFESTYPTTTTEGASASTIAFAISHGAYVVSSNNAGGVPAGGALAAYRANAAAAKYSRVQAERVYGASSRPRGYIYGASGGAYQTLGAAENTQGVWDGSVPMVPGVPNAIPSFQVSQLLALRVLNGVLPQIAEAMSPGGSGDPFAGLNAEQRAVLSEVTKLGFPLRGWWQHATLTGGAYAAVAGAVKAIDPAYVQDFWTKAGYEGSNPSVAAARLQHDSSAVAVESAQQLVLQNVPSGAVLNADLTVTSGPGAGNSATIVGVSGNTLRLSNAIGVAAGSAVRIDNSWLLALQYFPRYQVPDAEQYGWSQYRDAGGNMIHPQRPLLIGNLLAASSGGSVATGKFNGKMIMLASVLDVQAYPWSADWYLKRAKVEKAAQYEDSFRLWYMDNADHERLTVPMAEHHTVAYDSALQQALLYLDAWVESGTAPPANSSYTIDANNQVQLAGTAATRFGVQPVASLSGAGGAAGATINATVGEPVALTLKATVPPSAAKITRVEWDLKGTTGTFPLSLSLLGDAAPDVSAQQSITFTEPGTYFPVARVTAQRNDETSSPYGQVQNLARIRVVVKAAPTPEEENDNGSGAWSPMALVLMLSFAGLRQLMRKPVARR